MITKTRTHQGDPFDLFALAWLDLTWAQLSIRQRDRGAALGFEPYLDDQLGEGMITTIEVKKGEEKREYTMVGLDDCPQRGLAILIERDEPLDKAWELLLDEFMPRVSLEEFTWTWMTENKEAVDWEPKTPDSPA